MNRKRRQLLYAATAGTVASSTGRAWSHPARDASEASAHGRGHIEYLQVQDRAPSPHFFGSVPTGALAAELSIDRGSGAYTAIFQPRPFWAWPYEGSFSTDVELLVLAGSLRVGSTILAPMHHAFLPAGIAWDGMESIQGATVLWMTATRLEFVKSPSEDGEIQGPPIHVVDVASRQWTPMPSYAGKGADELTTGLAVKLLNGLPDKGPYTVLVRHAPGWFDPRLESHATPEELFLLEGDYLMGTTGALRAGAYIFRPGTLPHGPQATQTGAVWLARGDRSIDFKLEHSDWATTRVQKYVSAPAAVIDSERVPWGVWS